MLIDFNMPGISGGEVARRVQTTLPALPILFVTGYADRAALESVSQAHSIGKAFPDNELHAMGADGAFPPNSRQGLRLR